MSSWFLYIIRCGDGSLYTGITTDVVRRLAEHRSGGGKGAKYLRGRLPLTVVFAKKMRNKRLAAKAEYRCKRLSKARKERLVLEEGNLP